jgi:hypothetical protein
MLKGPRGERERVRERGMIRNEMVYTNRKQERRTNMSLEKRMTNDKAW